MENDRTNLEQPENKTKFLSIRVSAKEYAKIEEERAKMGYKTLSAFAVDRMTGVAPKKCLSSMLPDIARLYSDVEESLNYALRLEKRMLQATPENKADLEDLQAEIAHFKVFVAKKAEVLLYRVRDEHTRQTQFKS